MATTDPKPPADGLPGAPPPEARPDPGAGRRPTLRALLREARDISPIRASKYGLPPLLLLTLIDLVQQFDNTVFGLLLPEIRLDLGVSIGSLLGIVSLVGFVVLALNWFIGYGVDRWRRTWMVGFSAIGTGIFSLVTAGAQGLGQLGVGRSLDEASEQVGDLPLFSLLADYYPVEVRGKVFAFRTVMGSAGKLLAPIAVGIVAALYGWRAAYWVTGPALIAIGIWALVRLKEPVRGYWERRRLGADEEVAATPEPPLGMAEAFRTLMATRTLRRVFVAGAVSGIGLAWFSSLFGFYLFDRFGLGPVERAAVFVPSDLVGLAGAFIAGGVVDTLTRRRPARVLRFIGAVSALSAVGLVLVVMSGSLPVLVVMTIVFAVPGAILGPAQATVFSLVVPPRLRGQGLAIFAYAGIPALAVRGIAGSLADSLGLELAMVLATPFLLLGAVLLASAATYYPADVRSAVAASLATDESRRARAEGRTKLLVVRGLQVGYGDVQVLFDVDFDVDEGDIVALLGTNGAGKSTLLRAISGTQEATGGAVVLDGRDITHLPPYEIARLGVVQMPGGRGVFPGLSVRDNLQLALWSVDDDDRAARRGAVLEAFPRVEELLDREAGLLSGGEQQMVALAQAFATRPRLLMIDELSLGLAPQVVGDLLEMVRAIHASGTTVILVEQSVNLALTLAERAVFMEKGEVRFEGPTAELLARPDIMRSVYLKGSGGVTAAPAASRRDPGDGRPVLEVSGLTKRYGGVTAVDDVSLTLREGEALGLIGPNGAGKTTLFELISGYQPTDAGRVLLDGEDVTGASPDARARKRLIRRFQNARLYPSLTVEETVALSLERATDVRSMVLHAIRLPAATRSEAQVQARTNRLLELFDLGAQRHTFVRELSTGQRRIVDLACVVAAEPKVLLLDEPSTGIAQAEAEYLAPLLRRVRHETGCSLLVIEHDMQLITAISDELVAMVQGAVVTRGAPDDVLSHPIVVDAYLGDTEATLQRQGVLPS